MEYRGVWHHDGSIAFRRGPFENATNNIGEFLAIVHGLALMARRSVDWPVYSDSKTAISWVRKKDVRSRSMHKGETSQEINDLVERALCRLEENDYENDVLKWETSAWGEVPADYSRKWGSETKWLVINQNVTDDARLYRGSEARPLRQFSSRAWRVQERLRLVIEELIHDGVVAHDIADIRFLDSSLDLAQKVESIDRFLDGHIIR